MRLGEDEEVDELRVAWFERERESREQRAESRGCDDIASLADDRRRTERASRADSNPVPASPMMSSDEQMTSFPPKQRHRFEHHGEAHLSAPPNF